MSPPPPGIYPSFLTKISPNAIEVMFLRVVAPTPEGPVYLNLLEIVADVALALSEALKGSPPPYRGLSRYLTVLVLEIEKVHLDDHSATSWQLRQLLGWLAEGLNSAFRSDEVQAIYQQLMESKQRAGFRFPFFQSWRPCPPPSYSQAGKWKGFPYPALGMLNELLGSQFRGEIRLLELLSDDQQVLNKLRKLFKDWNQLVDLECGEDVDQYEANEEGRNQLASFLNEGALCGQNSVRCLSCNLHEVLHYNWPCSVEGHEHEGLLGHCFSAKLRLDPGWSCQGFDSGKDSFFVLLRGSDITQECRVCLNSSSLTSEMGTLVCQVDYEDTRLFCLPLAKDDHNKLWPQPLAEPLEIIQPDEPYKEHSLGQLLDVVKPTYAAKRVLGVILARSFLHLLGGPWIPRSFCIDDISVFCRLDRGRPYPLFDQIFLSTNFGQPSGSEPKPRHVFSVHPFPTILAFGIILTEIELGDDLSELYSDPDLAKLRKNRLLDLAKYLLRECERRFPESGLFRAVKFCIERESFLRFANTSIESLFSNQAFANSFYMGAIRPLEQDLVIGAKWTWDDVKWLKRTRLNDEGVCRIVAKLQLDESHSIASHQRQEQASSLTSPATVSEDIESPSLRSIQMQWQKRPSASETQVSRDEFEVAIICALPLEASAVLSLFDRLFDGNPSLTTQDPSDPNSYSLGVMGGRNVILAHQARIGKASAASVAAFCATSFPKVKLALLVGVCGAIPAKKNKEEILLGDVIISKGVMQYDFGRQFWDEFRQKTDVENLLGRPNPRISSSLARLETQVHRKRLQEKITQYLSEIKDPDLYPGEMEDRLFPPDYQHRHYRAEVCSSCTDYTNLTNPPTCQRALEATCTELECDNLRLVQRTRRNQRYSPAVHIGLIASGDSVIKSGVHRDRISKETGILGFEMEGAGVWDTIPCVIIKGVCDYADSHKNKLWQKYAAATAAACAKAFVRQW